MFFKQIRRNAAKQRKNNGLFFGSLIIAIVSFYTLLSLGSQDVIRFLKTMESNAIKNLMAMIPVVYAVSLFFVFFLIYFAYRYQLENRRKELGLYLLLGMKRRSLFNLLMGETLWNSLISVALGLPVALFLTEIVSLATSKLVGLGIIGHQISFSVPALLGTVLGFFAVQLVAMLYLSTVYTKKEPSELLRSSASSKQVPMSARRSMTRLVFGILLLLSAYAFGIFLFKTLSVFILITILILGCLGTFLVFGGLGAFLGIRIERKGLSRAGLFKFTRRQIQENVFYQHKALAISSLLFFMAFTWIAFGIVAASGASGTSTRSVDFSISADTKEVEKILQSPENKSMIKSAHPMRITSMKNDIGFSWGSLPLVVKSLPSSSQQDDTMRNFVDENLPYIIPLSDYNNILTALNKPTIKLKSNQVALYTSDYDDPFMDNMSAALKKKPHIEIRGSHYQILPRLHSLNIVADRFITIYLAFIVPDQEYAKLAPTDDQPLCHNFWLKPEIVKKDGLLQSFLTMTKNLSKSGVNFESYLNGYGRRLFVSVASSYLSIYLGALFIVIANTVLGIKFLIQLRTSRQRYATLLKLGADVGELCKSAKSQIRLFFLLIISVATINSAFAIFSLHTVIFYVPPGSTIYQALIILPGVSLILFIVIECIYVAVIEKTATREIKNLQAAGGNEEF